MKQLKIEIEKSSTDDRLKAYAIVKKSDAIKASDYLNIPFTVKDFVISNNTLFETETGEMVKEPMRCITILTDDGVSIGTNSQPMINSFLEIMEMIKDESREVQLMINQGTGKNGKFNTIELVL